MADAQILKNIESKILAFQSGSLKQNTLNLFESLGYESPHQMDIFENTPDGFLEYLKDNSRTINQNQAYFTEWKSVDFCLQLTNEESVLFESQVNNFDGIINSYLLFCIELNKKNYPNRALADITRAMNRVFPKPVFVLFKHGSSLTLSIINRRKHKRDSSKEVLEKITLIKDIDVSEPHRAHKEILFDLCLFELKRNFTIQNFDDLHSAWQSVLNISELNKKFYREISNWYFWARENVEFPNKPAKLKSENESEYHERVLSFNSMNLIRLITRLIFVWFLKEKGLIPDILFSEKKLKDLLLFNDKNKSTYYKAILQNLFFATLNQEMNTKQKPENRKFRTDCKHYNITNLYRYKSYFKDDKKTLALFEEIPFLNGGLFECLDKQVKNSSGEEEIIRIDGFSDRPDNPLKVPDELFFSEQFNIDLSKVYVSKNKNDKVRGIINILNNYKFTIAENTPVEEEVALDPELLGKVFENLLASYNPETGTTARKQTGSFYTPREIVNYMVDESLIAYLEQKLVEQTPSSVIVNQPPTSVMNDVQLKLRNLLSYSDEPHQFDTKEVDTIINAIDNIKILDPACGSGAFPMGILHKMVHIIHKLDPNNEKWKKRQIKNQTKEIKQDIDYAERIKDDVAREKALTELNEKLKNINDIFDNNELDYGRKLFLIENCIYGIDIQPIAVQIAKLRFFISLIVEQKAVEQTPALLVEQTPALLVDQTPSSVHINRGIIPLPNLETKFVAANTLIGIEKPELSLFRGEIDTKEKELEEIRQKYFTARTPATKLKYRDQDEKKRKEIESIFEQAGMKAEKASQLAKWNPYDQSASAGWFDMEWMFGIKDGFDIVIGNPPYGASYPDEHKIYFKENYYSAKTKEIIENGNKLKIKGSFDTFSLFIDRSFQCMNDGSFLSFIVPLAVSSSDSMTALHNMLLNNCENISISTYSNRPKKIFDNADQRVAIINFNKNKTKTKKLFTTKVNKRYDDTSTQELINNLKFVNSIEFIKYGRIPKIGTPIEISILKKLYSIKTNLKDLMLDKGLPVFYRAAGGRYYNIITNFSTNSSAEKSFLVKRDFQNIIAAVLSSNLYYWFYHIYSDTLNMKLYELEILPIPIEKLIIQKDSIENIYKLYLKDLHNNSKIKKVNYSHITEYREYYARRSKHLIDKIDLAIKDAYGLTDEEINFIINYDIKFRTDDEE